MKASGAAAGRLIARPELGRAGWLIFGADPMRVALKRQELILGLIGPDGEAEMRLTRIPASDLRRDGALVSDAMRATGFFPGPRATFVEDAGDGLAPVIGAALSDWREGDAVVVVTAGQLTSKSALRKVFEAHPNAYAIGLYDDPPSREEIEAELRRAGMTDIDREAVASLTDLSRLLGPGDFRQTLGKLALYKRGDATPVTPEDIVAVAPTSTEVEIDDLLDAVSDGDAHALGPLLRRIESQGTTPVTLCIGATRHFRQLHAIASAPGGDGIGLLRPQPFGARRDRMLRQARVWGLHRLEEALAHLVETDLTLRSSARAPAMSLIERALIRLARMPRR